MTFRLRAGDDATRALMERVNASGELYLTHTMVNGNVALRMAIGSPLTERRHVEAAWQHCRRRPPHRPIDAGAPGSPAAGSADADHALLDDAGEVPAVLGEEPPRGQPAAPRRGR